LCLPLLIWCNECVKKLLSLFVVSLAVSICFFVADRTTSAQSASETGSVGVSGVVNSPAPAIAPVISLPRSGDGFSTIPITVRGICENDLLVKVFKNGVFAGSTQCQSGSFSLSTDLFNGQNELTARQYDLLDQESPASSVVTVTYNDNAANATALDRITLTTNFAKKGANPKEELVWPFAISGGSGPYAVTVEWGDGNTDLQSIANPGEFTIKHTYNNPGSYTVIVKAVDVNGRTALLQVVAIANGSLDQTNTGSGGSSNGGSSDGEGAQPKTRILWQPAAIMIPFIISTFWLGKRYAIHRLRKKIEAGERPFNY
jgi:hypothetical protein